MARFSHTTLIRWTLPLLLSAVTGCLEYETTTAVRTDGSFRRSITVTGDSSAIYSWNFKIPADSTWTVLERTKVEDKKWTLKAERDFASEDAWTIWEHDLDRRTLHCSVHIEQHFNFFTTTYRFTETIASYNPFTLIPVTDYISPSELDMFLRVEVLKESAPTRGDSLALDDAGDRFEEWEGRTRVESFFRTLVKHLDPASGLDSVRLAEIKESMVQYYLHGEKDNDYSISGIKEWAGKINERALLRAIDAGSAELESLKRDIDFTHSVGADSYTSRVEMPGEISYTNGKQEGLHGATWENYIAYAYVHDFTMVAESSVVNLWAIVLALVVIIGTPILVWVAHRERKRKSAVGLGTP